MGYNDDLTMMSMGEDGVRSGVKPRQHHYTLVPNKCRYVPVQNVKLKKHR